MQLQTIRPQIDLIRSCRRTVCLELTNNGHLLVRAPYLMSEREIQNFILSKSAWIEKQLALVEKRRTMRGERLTETELRKLMERARRVLPDRVAYFAEMMGISYGRITVRCQKTRWGSCSQKGNLNFNCLLLLTPPEVLDYVVVHELCHRKEMNHSVRFWAEVEKVLPDYRTQRRWLRENGGALIERVR